MSEKTARTDATTGSEEPTELRDAQRRIRDAYFEHDAGLYVLNCNPGAGKSLTDTRVTAEELLRRYADGDPTPEQHVCVVSFTREDATEFVPAVIEQLRDLVAHDMTPAAAALSEADVAYLSDRVRQAPLIGTIDSVVRTLLGEFAAAVGFAEMPDVGTEGQLTRLHAACYEAIVTDPAYAEALAVVEAAYPPGAYDDGPGDLLRKALHHCRARRVTITAFARDLRRTVEAAYEEGATTSIEEIRDALARCVGRDAATAACEGLVESERAALLAGDQHIHTAWGETIAAFETLLERYAELYRRRTRERGVISHTDCAFLVTEFLSGNLVTDDTASRKRDRVLTRYQDRIESLIIDEAQDISRLQHDALAQLVTGDCRVLAAGDLRQSVYVWREAHPERFRRAADRGEYLGIDWDRHVTETAATTYRCRPDVAAAVNAIAEPVFTDPTRGNIGELDVTYPRLDAAREPSDGPNVHIAAFDTDAQPGTTPYVAPDRGKGEAGMLATYIARGLADGTFEHGESAADDEADHEAAADTDTEGEDERDAERETDTDPNAERDGDTAAEAAAADDPDGTDPTVTALFRWRTHMDRYRQVFEAENLAVADASQHLFDCPAVTAAIDVAEWLQDPFDTARTHALVTDSALGLSTLEATFDRQDWHLDAVREALPDDGPDDQRAILDKLHQLREKRPLFREQSAARSLAAIIDTVALRADPNGIASTQPPAQRIANLDTLLELVGQWTTESRSTLADVTDILTHYRDTPHTGPTQPVVTDDHDVVFKTIHQMKGDESDIVALADLGFPLRKHGPVGQRFVATGSMVGLAPPMHAAAPGVDALSVFTRGVYDPDGGDSQTTTADAPGDVGLRWASERWTDEIGGNDAAVPQLVGHDHIQTATRLRRAEAWRLLFVALSRTRDHLVVPLPREVPDGEQPRDRWLEPIRDGLGFDGTPSAGTYTRAVTTPDGSTRSIDIAVNTVDLLSTQAADDDAPDRTPFAATTPPDETALPGLVPRILRPSTLQPLTEAFEDTILQHLQGRPLHTEADTVADAVPLTLDAFDTETVGAFVHSVLTRCVAQGLSAHDLQTVSQPVEEIIDAELQAHGPPATRAERDGLIEFLTDWVLPTFVTSELWTQLAQADAVYTEKPLRAHPRRDDIEFELEGQADFVITNPDGSWTIADTKIALTEPTADTRRRYRTQVACYAWLLATETDVDDPTEITTAIKTLGVVTDRTIETPSASVIPTRLDELLDERG